jgi:hypothetical protein
VSSTAQELRALRKGVLILAHALRLNTTCPSPDQTAKDWPRDEFAVLQRCRDLISQHTLYSPTLCAVAVLLDEETADWTVFDQEALLARIDALAQVEMISGSEPDA